MNMLTALHSWALIFPIASSSTLSLSIPPSIWGFCSSFLIGKNTYIPIRSPTTKMITLIGPTAMSQSE